ncbi:MAG: bacteriochlorophyll 4-vinyl reductase [Cypionkella sp.]|jgi:divinyl protochlorophyllide a 8-vinyl-reductase|nr:bacteriochlorophyll 4-vinyl reductase [Cypionkella sp.]
MDGGFPPLSDGARIGPNAILQLVAVLDDQLGQTARNRVMHAAGQVVPPSDAGMWPEAACRAVHLTVYRDLPDRAETLMALAGTATADYILSHRIPGPAKALIRALPTPLGARLLTAAITHHAWTFAGSGRFAVTAHRPLTVEIADNPLTPGAGRTCHWHAAVFTRLYRVLVWPSALVEATEDCRISRFVVRPR